MTTEYIVLGALLIVKREGFSCFFPLASMLLVSLLLSLALTIILRLLNR